MGVSSAPDVVVRWQRVSRSPLEVEHAAREVVELLLCHMQSSRDGVEVFLPARSAAADERQLDPISYRDATERLISLHSEYGERPTHAITDRGRILKLKPRRRVADPSTLDEVSALPGSEQKRRPMAVNLRPGKGGAQRLLNPGSGAAGLEEYNVKWWPGTAGAMLGRIDLDPNGNAVGMCRLSGDDRNDTLVNQVESELALAAAYPDDLRYRCLLLADDMSGMREVRPPRTLPPPPGSGINERDDILIVDQWLDEGWLEHLVWRDERRIARDVLPAELILRMMKRKRAHLWLANYGRRLDWKRDSVFIRVLQVISAEDRDHTTTKLFEARFNKGPASGHGWRNTPPPFGFTRNAKTLEYEEDDEQWPWIHRAHDLAEIGLAESGGGLSLRGVVRQLAAEGCPFGVETLHRILTDDLYVTGEYTHEVGGVPIAQIPISLSNPISKAQRRRIQDLFALRKGSTKNTPLGEFLFNYHETLHKKCMDGDPYKGKTIQIHGWVLAKSPNARTYRHYPVVPECCKGTGRGRLGAHAWQREELEAPAVHAVRELVNHPEILRQAIDVVQQERAHSIGDGRLTPEVREQLERERQSLTEKQDVFADQWLNDNPDESDFSSYFRADKALTRKIEGITRRLEADNALVQHPVEPGALWHGAPSNEMNDLKEAFLEILTIETPDDPFMKELRARLWQLIVHRVIIDDSGEGAIMLTLEGHLVPEYSPNEAKNPLMASRDLLRDYIDDKNGETTTTERELERLERERNQILAGAGLNGAGPKSDAADDDEAHTVVSYANNKTVLTSLHRDLDPEVARRIRKLEGQRLESTSWVGKRTSRGGSARAGLVPAWKLIVRRSLES